MSAANVFDLIIICSYVFSGLLGLGFGLVFWLLAFRHGMG